MTGKTLEMLPSRLESFAKFKERAADGKVLVPGTFSLRNYGSNPYVGYDGASAPFLYNGDMPEGIEPMERVVAVGKQAWPLTQLRERGIIEKDGLVIRWQAGQNSALDARRISKGRDVGNVTVQRDGHDIVHDITFAFVFHAFRPEGKIHLK